MTSPLEDLVSRSYKTYLARVEAARRLRNREYAWNAALISLTVATTVAAVALLVDAGIFGPRGEVLMVCLAVLGLAASLVVPSLNYSRRANDMFTSYRRIQQLSSEAERAQKAGMDPDCDESREMADRYQSLLDHSENHSKADYMKAAREIDRKDALKAARDEGVRVHVRAVRPPLSEMVLTFLPYLALLVPAALMVRVAVWFVVA
jgi:hypothetical protein